MLFRPKPLVLLVLDGWGVREATEYNAIASANTPCWDRLWASYPHHLLQGSGAALGLPAQQMGNSEVGHLTLGAGRTVHQDLTRIDTAIEDGSFFQNETFLNALQQAKAEQKSVHLIGLLSPGGVHSHERHFHALLEMIIPLQVPTYIHAFLDGRDTLPSEAQSSLEKLNTLCEATPSIKIASLIGRYYAMDRDQRWDRTQQAYELIVHGQAEYHAATVFQGLTQAYERGETDEFVQATALHAPSELPVTILEGDLVFFMNFRADRARQLTQALIDPQFNPFNRERSARAPYLTRAQHPKLMALVSLTHYSDQLKTAVAFPPQRLSNTFGHIISQHKLSQLRIAETEKYAHVTFFFSGRIETPFPGEERYLVASPKVATYDLKPEMGALEITQYLENVIKTTQFDVIICNFANPDMVGHTGNFQATVKAIEWVDHCLMRIITALDAIGGEIVITADHGNAETLYDDNVHQAHTAHTCAPVPFIYVGRPAKIKLPTGQISQKSMPSLSAIAPTLLYILGLPKPEEMTGDSLIQFE